MLSKFGFLLKYTQLNKTQLRKLIGYPEVNEMLELYQKKNWEINAQTVYEIVEKLYFPLRSEGSSSALKTRLYNALRQFSKDLYGDPAYWHKDYEAYIAAQNSNNN